MTPFRTILHPTDFSESSDHAFRLACALAQDYKARLLLLHVREVPVALTGNPDAFPQERPEAVEAIRQRLHGLRPADPQAAIEHHLLDGDPAATAIAFAVESGCDLIVLGTHGRTGLGRLLLGSVAEQIVRKAPCPVLTVKTPSEVQAAQSPYAVAYDSLVPTPAHTGDPEPDCR